MVLRATIAAVLLFLLSGAPCTGTTMKTTETGDVTIVHDPALDTAARELAGMYRGLRSDVEVKLGRRLDAPAVILLVKSRDDFAQMAGSDRIVAYAAPDQMSLVIDYSRMNVHPFTLPTTVKHELCHLVLHRHAGDELPRWLDEGICQWASEGFAEVITGDRTALLARAAASGNYIPLTALDRGFPRSDPSLSLAYEESKSFVEYLMGRFGRDAVFNFLAQYEQGHATDEAFTTSFSKTLPELERDWQRSLRGRGFWITYVSSNLYLILFAAGALLLVVAFIRYVKRKRAYRDDEVDDDRT